MNSTMVSRMTSKGLLSITTDGTTIAATLAGRSLVGACARFSKPIPSPIGKLGGSWSECGLTVAETDLVMAEQARIAAAYAATPRGQRDALVAQLCETDAFPGSREWARAQAARAALEAFDAAHPAVAAAACSVDLAPAGSETLDA